MKQDDIFFAIGFMVCLVLVILHFHCGDLVALVLSHKGISVADDKFGDKIREMRPLDNERTQ